MQAVSKRKMAVVANDALYSEREKKSIYRLAINIINITGVINKLYSISLQGMCNGTFEVRRFILFD